MSIEPETNSVNITSMPGEIQPEPPSRMDPSDLLIYPPLAGFWRRVFAWCLDMFLLGILGLLLGFMFSDFLFGIGPYGRPLGMLVVLPYFGWMNSKHGGGQTIGKRWMKIAVRNTHNQPIELWRSFLRIGVLAVPILFNGWQIPIFQNKVLLWIDNLVVWGLGGAIIYTMVFNRRARQGLHDMLLGTVVVHLDGIDLESFPTTASIHRIISAGWVGLVVFSSLLSVFVSLPLQTNRMVASEQKLYEILAKDSRFFNVGVQNNYSIFGSNSSHNLIITVWVKGKLVVEEQDELMNSIVKTALVTHPDIEDFDGIKVTIRSAYDICIASAYVNYSYSETLIYWINRIFPGEFTYQWNGSLPVNEPLFNAFKLTAIGKKFTTHFDTYA